MSYVQLIASNKLNDLAWDILLYLTNAPEANKWQISKEIKRAYSGIYKTIKDLLGFNFIRVTRTEPGTKNPRIEVEYYSLTNIGLLHTLTLRGSWDIDKIAQVHYDKMLFFKKWHLIQDDEVKQFITKEFITALHEVLNYLWSRDYLKSNYPNVMEFDEKEFEKICFRDVEKIVISKFVTYAFNLLRVNIELMVGEPKKTISDARNTVNNLLNDPEFNQHTKLYIESSIEFHVQEYNYYKLCLEKIFE